MSAAHRPGTRFRLRLLQDSRRGGLPLLPPQVSNRRLLGRFLEGEPGNGTTLRVCAGWRLDLLFRRSDMEKLTAKQTASDLTEAEAIKQAKEGDAAAFEFLYKAHCRRVYSLCLRMIKNPAEAEDLTQQAFLQLFRKIGTFRGESGFSTWLHRVTVNIVLMHLRRHKPDEMYRRFAAIHKEKTIMTLESTSSGGRVQDALSGRPKVAIVTGASSGIGLGMVKRLIEKGCRVVANSRKITSAMTLHSTADLKLVDGDIGIEETAKHVVRTAIQNFGTVDLLVNNAGVFIPKPFTEYTAEDFRRATQTNLAGFFYVSQLAVAQMRLQKFGHVVNISTSLVSQPIAGVPGSVANLTKAGLESVTRALGIEGDTLGRKFNRQSSCDGLQACLG